MTSKQMERAYQTCQQRSLRGGGRLPKACIATGSATVNNQTAAANLNTTFLTLGALSNLGSYIDSSPFSLQSGKIKCALAGAVWVDMLVNAKTASAYGWLQPYICFNFPDGTAQRIQVGHARGQPSTSYGSLLTGNTLMSISAGTLVSIGIVSAQNGATLGNTYWCKIIYLYSPDTDTTGG